MQVVLDVEVAAWEKEYRTSGAHDTGEDVRAYVRELVAGSHPAAIGLWRVVEHPSGWSAPGRPTRRSASGEQLNTSI